MDVLLFCSVEQMSCTLRRRFRVRSRRRRRALVLCFFPASARPLPTARRRPERKEGEAELTKWAPARQRDAQATQTGGADAKATGIKVAYYSLVD